MKRAAISILRLLITFRKPRFNELHFVDIVVHDKPLLLVVWDLKNGNRIQIKPLKIRFIGRSGAKIVNLTDTPEFVTIIARNFWRSIKQKVVLKYLTLDDATVSKLLDDLCNPSTVHFKHFEMENGIILCDLELPTPRLISINPGYKKEIRILSERFTYQ